jgi:hypothetical protein
MDLGEPPPVATTLVELDRGWVAARDLGALDERGADADRRRRHPQRESGELDAGTERHAQSGHR